MSNYVKRMSLGERIVHQRPGHQCNQRSFRNSRVYGPDSLSIIYLKNLGHLATEHLTSLYNNSLKSCHLPSIWKTSLVSQFPSRARTHRMTPPTKTISLLCQQTRSLRRSFYPLSTNFSHQLKKIIGFRPRHSTISASIVTQTSRTGFHYSDAHLDVVQRVWPYT